MAYVLVVDDDPDLHVLVQDILSSLGVEGRVAYNGQAGLKMAREEPPAAVILDLVMPEVDGYGFLQAAQADSSLLSVPVIVLSAYVDEHQYDLESMPNVIGVVSKGLSPAGKISGYLKQALR